ncbi:uncharacterized protein LOC142357819 [Convolutriloba macropyga]|uniref:uncharacterized protein LOC142357819 n=1 Tax=Convolutriloba macropyga TaxID=536237 RepID=UPI003F5282E7
MHTYTSVGSIPDRSSPMVCIPGYGAGVGFFWKNLEGLRALDDLYAVDPLGTGLSSRPPFNAKTTVDAEEFFIKALLEWRQAVGIDKMVLVGHSMGGYLATVYALKHPEHVKHLILVSPAGISSMSVSGLLWRAAKASWNSGLTPGTVTRTLGPWGPKLVDRYVSRRFRYTGEGLTDAEVEAFRDYQYHILAQNGSGEHALRHILQPFAWAKSPLEHRIQDLKVPVTFIYGDKDWMLNIDENAPSRAVKNLSQASASPPASPLDRKILTVPDAGHYVFIDQPDRFKAIMDQIYEGLA